MTVDQKQEFPLKVMLVDDNPNFLQVIQEYLEREGGYRVEEAVEDAAEALSLARKMKPELVVLDLGMPGMTGLEVLPLMRSALPKAKIVVMTLLDSDSYRKAALRSGADGFVSKSALKQELLPTISQLIGTSKASVDPKL